MERLPKVRVVVLQHGYHGGPRDFKYLASILQQQVAQADPQGSLVVLNPDVNQGFRTDEGVLACGARLAAYLEEQLRPHLQSPADANCLTEVQINFVCHSMGGLMLRAALPILRDFFASQLATANVSYGTCCMVCTPQVGVAYMPSRFRAWLAWGVAGIFRSKGLQDMLLQSDVLPSVLLQEDYLKEWRRFERRVAFSVVNDTTVMPYSSGFSIAAEHYAALARYTGCHATPAVPPAVVPTSTSAAGTLRPASLPPPQMLTELTSAQWPEALMPRERTMASRILAAVGPIEHYSLDLRPVADTDASGTARQVRYGAYNWAHRAVICKEPVYFPDSFGYVSDNIARDVLGL